MSGPPLDPARAPRALLSGRPRAIPRPGPAGAVSWVTLLLLVAVAVGGYLGWVWLPIYVENYAVKQVVHDHMNQAVKNPDDDGLRRNMVAKLRSLAQVDTLDAYGRPVRLPAVGVEERDVVWERDAESQPPMLRVSFEYTREVLLPILDRTASKVFVVEEQNDLTQPDWGPAR
jgi:hypothetical protein